MAKVAPFSDADFAGFKFKRPIPTEPPMTEYDSSYLKRRAQASASEKRFTCKSGRTFAYFTEGNSTDPPVLFIHGACQNKYLWLQPQPIVGIYAIVVDRMGHGNSSPQPSVGEGGYSFEEGVGEFVELLDSLDVDKLYIVGHSMGGTWALQLAAALGDRILGIAPISALCDTYHVTVSAKERKTLVASVADMIANPHRGCCGCLKTCLVKMIASGEYYADKTKDYGMASKYVSTCKGQDGGDERAFSVMDKDHFFVMKTMDSYLWGMTDPAQMIVDFHRALNAWSFDTSSISCRCFIYNGEKEVTPLTQARQNEKLVKDSVLVIMPEHGHSTILMETEKIVIGLINGKSVTSAHTDTMHVN